MPNPSTVVRESDEYDVVEEHFLDPSMAPACVKTVVAEARLDGDLGDNSVVPGNSFIDQETMKKLFQLEKECQENEDYVDAAKDLLRQAKDKLDSSQLALRKFIRGLQIPMPLFETVSAIGEDD